jgi:hypothetical protein
MRKRFCHDHKTWTWDNWSNVVRSDESSPFTLIRTLERVYVCKTQSGMPCSNSETWRRFYSGLASNIVIFCWSHCHPSWPKYDKGVVCERLGYQLNSVIQTLFPNKNAFAKDERQCPIHFTQLKLFSRGLKRMKMNFIICLCQHNNQICTPLNHCCELWRLVRNKFPPPTSLKQLEVVLEEYDNKSARGRYSSLAD